MTNYYLIDFTNVSENNEERFNHYFQSGTKVLKNLLKISDNQELHAVEKYLVSLNYKNAVLVEPTFDFKHLQAIHKQLFKDIYPFAGQLRQANMGKSTTGEIYYDRQKSMFMDYEEIPFHVSFLENYLFSKNFLAGITVPIKFAQEICEVYLFINDIHAFREGNGRAQNEFIRQLAEKNGFILNIQERIESFIEQGVNYYQWFHTYNLTGD